MSDQKHTSEPRDENTKTTPAAAVAGEGIGGKHDPLGKKLPIEQQDDSVPERVTNQDSRK